MEFERWHFCLFHRHCWDQWFDDGVSLRWFHYRRGWSVTIVPGFVRVRRMYREIGK
jgi:hypothetical protein